MFTGLIEEMGSIVGMEIKEYGSMTIKANKVLSEIKIGDSIAVNGICLTVTKFTKNSFTVDVMAETIRRSSLNSSAVGDFVNLERAMAVNGRFGGHIVSGHIDGIGIVIDIYKEGNASIIYIEAENTLLKYMAQKGSVTIDGISLTIAGVGQNNFWVSVIPHTIRNTALWYKRKKSVVNLETDIIAKYLDRLNHFENNTENKSDLNIDFLTKCGF